MKVVEWLKNDSKILELISYAPEYVNNVEKTLASEAKKLEVQAETTTQEAAAAADVEEDGDSYVPKEDQETDEGVHKTRSTEMKSETQIFNEYKEKVRQRVEGDVADYMVDSITKTWEQPWLQSKIEYMIVSAGKATFQRLGSLWPQDSQTTTSGDTSAESEAQSANEESDRTAEVDEKKAEQVVGEGNCERQLDSNGNVVVQPKTYEDVVQGLGQGRTAGLLEMQMVADATGCTIEIIDKTIEQDFKSDSGEFAITPEGKSNGKIQMIYTKNPDGTKHVELVGADGKPVEIPQSSDGTPPNRCLYEAVAKAQNCSVDQLLDNVKTHATTNKQAQYLYAEKLDEALPNLRVGRKCSGRNAKFSF